MLTSSPSFPSFRFYICGINVIHDSSAISVGFPGSSSSSHEWIFDMFIPSPLFKSITATTDCTDWLIKKKPVDYASPKPKYQSPVLLFIFLYLFNLRNLPNLRFPGFKI